MYGVIYLIMNLINGKPYVGQTKHSLKRRFAEHAKADSLIGNAIRKYDRENFSIEVLEECDTPEQLNEREIFWIRELNSKAPNGYNLTDGGEGASGLIHTPEHNARIGLANRGQKRSDESRARMSKTRTLIAERAYSPYVTLVALLAERVISYTELAKAVGITQEGMSYKMCGKHQFSLVQMEIIRTYLGVIDMTLEELFRREDGSVPDMTPKPYVYPVLAAILQKKRVTFKRLAKVLGVDKSTVSYKMRGKSEFTPEQKAAIRDFLQVDTLLEELFKRQ